MSAVEKNNIPKHSRLPAYWRAQIASYAPVLFRRFFGDQLLLLFGENFYGTSH
jgi:hypothetical protein